MGADVDVTLLRVVAHAFLGNIDTLLGEGLAHGAVAVLRDHATTLTARDPIRRIDRAAAQAHGVALWELLSELHGPASATLMAWLDDALGGRAGSGPGGDATSRSATW
jgi:hypothetical protein